MTMKNLDQLIEAARNHYHDRNLVAFLGEVGSGKTVVSALLKHATFNHFIPRNRGKYEAIISHGSTIINRILGDMIKDGLFPPSTVPQENPSISMEIHILKGRGVGKVELVLQDMSGENYSNFLTKEFSDSEKRLYQLLTFNKSERESIGPLAHLPFSKVYVILIDCSKRKYWEHEQSSAGQMITALKQIKELAKDTKNGRIWNPIAIVFTKTDQLDEKERDLPAEELIKKMPEFVSSLNLQTNGPCGYFKMFVEVEMESERDREARINREEEITRENFERKLKQQEEEIQNAIEKAIDEARNKATQEGKNPQQVEQEVERVRNETESTLRAEYQPETFTFNREEFLKTETKLMTPLKYSNGEYSKFISWILTNCTR